MSGSTFVQLTSVSKKSSVTGKVLKEIGTVGSVVGESRAKVDLFDDEKEHTFRVFPDKQYGAYVCLKSVATNPQPRNAPATKVLPDSEGYLSGCPFSVYD